MSGHIEEYFFNCKYYVCYHLTYGDIAYKIYIQSHLNTDEIAIEYININKYITVVAYIHVQYSFNFNGASCSTMHKT